MSKAIFLSALCLLAASLAARFSNGEVVNGREGNITSRIESAYDLENCIEITLPNILQLDECLGDNLNLCQGKTTLVEGVLSLTNCTVSGVVKNLSPVRVLITIKDLLIALLGKLIPPQKLTKLDPFTEPSQVTKNQFVTSNISHTEALPIGTGLNALDKLVFAGDRNIEDSICHGEVKITVPNSLGKCVDDTLKLCKDGETIDISLAESLGKTVACIVKDLLTKAPRETVSGLLCDVARLLSAVIGQVPGGSILSKPVNEICKSR